MAALIIAAALMAVAAARVAEAQQSPTVPSCASELLPCANYLNSTNPPSSCCDPLRKVVTTELPCLCNLYENPAIFASLNINITQALELPRYCHVAGDVSACKAAAPSSSTGNAPPAVPGGNPGSGAGEIAGFGLSSLLLLLASSMLF